MGYTISWAAFKDLSLAEAALALGLAQTGQSDTIADFEFNGAELAGWSVVLFNDTEPGLTNDPALAELSAGREIVIVHVNETTMFQSAELWRDGRRSWRVRHDAQVGPRHLDKEGELPPSFDAISQRLMAKQDETAGVDVVSEIPLETAEQITGFRHDRMGPEFDELEPSASARPLGGFVRRMMQFLR